MVKRYWRLSAVVVSVIIALVGFRYFIKHNKPALAYTMSAVERGNIEAVVSATGVVSAVNSVDVSSKITGQIKEVKVKENDRVKAGETIILLDDTRLRSEVSQARTQLLNVAANYERSRRLAAVGAISAKDLDTDRTNYQVAKDAYDIVVAQLDDTVIKAPIDGAVIGKPIPAGQTVSPGISSPMVLLTIVDMSKMQVQAQVDETDIGRVQLGQKVDFTVDTYPGKTFTGIVSKISKKSVIQQNVVYYTVYVDIDSPEGLLPTMTARVTIKIDEHRNVLVVPLSAVKENKGQKYVQVIRNNQPESVPVQAGLADDEKVEILSGLNEGERIVLPVGNPQSTPNAGQGMPGLRLFGR